MTAGAATADSLGDKTCALGSCCSPVLLLPQPRAPPPITRVAVRLANADAAPDMGPSAQSEWDDLPMEQRRFEYAMRRYYIKGTPRPSHRLDPPGVYVTARPLAPRTVVCAPRQMSRLDRSTTARGAPALIASRRRASRARRRRYTLEPPEWAQTKDQAQSRLLSDPTKKRPEKASRPKTAPESRGGKLPALAARKVCALQPASSSSRALPG